MTIILDGKSLATSVRQTLKEKVASLTEQGITPGLVVLLVGEDHASQVYVRNKERAAQEVGFHSVVERLSSAITQAQLLEKIEEYNHRTDIDGILVQMPLPAHIDSDAVLEAIAPEKDIDGFHPINLGKLLQKDETIVPCTPKGILRLLEAYEIDLVGKHVVVIGQSTIVGRPMALLALNHGATVTVCHSRTQDLLAQVQQADILISAVGKVHLITREMIKPGAVVIDVGINRLDNGKLVGDVDFEAVKEVASAITPVPGGVGPMTIAMLLEQTYYNALQRGKNDE